MKAIVILLCLSILVLSCDAQKALKGKPQFTSYNIVGLLSGSNGESALLQTINGITVDKWFAGAGVGLDYYGLRSVPVFASVHYSFVRSKNYPFLYVDAGLNCTWLTFNQKENEGLPQTKSGLFYETGIGYNVSLRKKHGFVFSAGYSFKETPATFNRKFYISSFAPPLDYLESKNYNFRRIAVKVAFKI